MIVRVTDSGGRYRMDRTAIGLLYPVKAYTLRINTKELIVHVGDHNGRIWTLGPGEFELIQGDTPEGAVYPSNIPLNGVAT